MIKIEVQDQNVLAAFNELLRRSQVLTPAMREISQALNGRPVIVQARNSRCC